MAHPAQPRKKVPVRGEEHKDVQFLREEEAEAEDEQGYSKDGLFKQADVGLRTERSIVFPDDLAKRQKDILDEEAAPGVEIGVVGGNEGGEHDRAEDSEEANGEDLHGGDAHQLLGSESSRGEWYRGRSGFGRPRR